MADLIDRDALRKDLRSECPESEACTSCDSCIDCIVNRQPAVESDYEQGFKDGLKSECHEELKPAMAKLIDGCTEAIKGITPMMIENAQLHITHAVNRWIPCSERLPKDRDNVLTYDLDGNVRKCEYDAEFKKFRPEFTKYYAMNVSYVTHWMPLPEPPETEVKPDA